MRRPAGSPPCRPFVLEHSRQKEPLLAGAPEAYARAFELAPRARISADLRAAVAAGAREIVLSGTVVNPVESHAEALARAFLRAGVDAAIPTARWLPQGPRTPAAAALLRRVGTLEVDFPSASPSAARMFHPACRMEAVADTVAWLRESGIEPVLCIWTGLPGDDEHSLLETLRRAYALRPIRVTLRGLVAPPGSWLAGQTARLGLIVEPEPPYNVLGDAGTDPFSSRWALEIARKSAAGYNLWTRAAKKASLAPHKPPPRTL